MSSSLKDWRDDFWDAKTIIVSELRGENMLGAEERSLEGWTEVLFAIMRVAYFVVLEGRYC